MMQAIPKVLHVSTHHEPCGIGNFQQNCVDALNENGGTINDFYQLSLNKIKKLNNSDRKSEINNIVKKSKKYNLVHIQHEFGFFYKDGLGFRELVEALKETGIPVIVTIHTAPELLLVPETINSKSLKGLLGYILRKRRNKITIKDKIKPFAKADRIITFNNFTKDQLISLAAVMPERIYKTMLPVSDVKQDRNIKIREIMNAVKGDVILCVSGFINPYKGFDNAVKALKYLPDNYKLAILGGINPDSGNPAFYDNLCDLIITLGLEKRVYISGYVKSDDELFSLMQGCDIALYPYSPDYYKMASSDAINKAIGCHLPVIAYPATSFIEINQIGSEVLKLTESPNYYELVKSIHELDADQLIFNESVYIDMYNYQQMATDITALYKNILEI